MQRVILAICAGIALFLAGAAGASAASASTTGAYAALATSTPVEPATPAVRAIASRSPVAGAILSPIVGGIDTGRRSAAALLQSQIRFAGGKLPGAPLLFGGKTAHAPDPNHFDWHSTLQSAAAALWTAYFYLLVISRFIVASAVLCYALLAAVIVLCVYKSVRRLRRR